MPGELSDEEKQHIASEGKKYLADIAARYELDNELGMSALLEAFQVGIKFTVQQIKEANDD